MPTTIEEAKSRGWNRLDIILITGDAYVDHPSFGAAIVGRYLESIGARVGIIASPDIAKPDDFTKLGRPEWFFGVTAGNLDSMIMRYTANKKYRSDDAYLSGGKAGRRPERATIAYSKIARKLFPNTPIILGGLEASLRRFAHYDYWDDAVRRSILFDTKADLLVYGMAERPLKDIVEVFKKGETIGQIKGVRGTACVITKDERKEAGDKATTIPSFEEVARNKRKYARASKIIHQNQNPGCAKTLVQKHGGGYLLVNPPAWPLTEKELDAVYDLPFVRAPHIVYKEKIPAFEMIKFSITAMRGCFGGCSFCALTVHQGRAIQSRSEKSILNEVTAVTAIDNFAGYVSDIGGPTANMYKMVCGEPAVEAVCRKISCVHPTICSRLVTDHGPQMKMLARARKVKSIKKVFVASGVRYDLANRSPKYIEQLVTYHVSGQLKIAPEHVNADVLKVMRKPAVEEFNKFQSAFKKATIKAGLEQYLVPYFISAHPGCDLPQQVELAVFLKAQGIRPRQAQDFIPAPMTLAADMYHTGLDPMTGKPVFVAKSSHDRKLQRALLRYYKPENADDVREALVAAHRKDLIGGGAGSLVSYKKDKEVARHQKKERRKRK